MKKVLFTGFLILMVYQAMAQKKVYNILFKTGQAELYDKQRKELKDIAHSLKDGDDVMIHPLTYDTIFGVITYSKAAKSQATAITEYARTLGFILKGTSRNFPSGFSGYSMSLSMKYYKDSATDIEPLFQTLKDYYPEKPSQYFLVNPKRDTLIIGNEGTKLFFASGSLISSQTVTVELKEYYSLQDYMKGGLPTVSNGRMLQTGGSMYLNATENGSSKKQVQINQDKGVGVDFTIGKKDTLMKVFIKDPRSAELNWILPPARQVKESWQMTETVIENGKVVSSETYKSKEAWEQHRKDVEKKEQEKKIAEANKQETLNKMDSKLKVFNFGYINCDRFPDEPLITFATAADEKTPAEYYLIYSDIRSVLKGDVSNGQVTFGSIAKNRNASLIGVSFINKKAFFFKAEVTPGGRLKSKIELQPVEESFLNQQMALLK